MNSGITEVTPNSDVQHGANYSRAAGGAYPKPTCKWKDCW